MCVLAITLRVSPMLEHSVTERSVTRSAHNPRGSVVLCHELQGPCRLTERLRDRERKPACRLLICLRHLASLLVSPVEDARGNPRLQTPCIAALA